MTLGATGNVDLAYQVARGTGDMLRHFGINMNYAPVGDINSEPLNPVIGVRSPGDDAELVGQYASACARGMRDTRVVPCIKHFPGHGDTAVDSHYGLPVIDKSRQQLDAVELVPFRRAADEAIEAVMTAHISLPQLLGSSTPATLSPKAISILRDEFKYNGLIVTDCLEMDGVRATYGTVESALMALQAGVDSPMICHTFSVQSGAVDRICQAIESGEISDARIEESLARLQKLKSRYTNWDTALQAQSGDELVALNERNAKLAQQVYSDATTVVRVEDGLFPLSASAKTLFVSPGPNVQTGGGAVASGDASQPTRVPWVSSAFADEIKKFNSGAEEVRFTEGSSLSDAQWAMVENSDVVILATRNARETPYQQELGREIAKRRQGRALVSIATCNPYDFLDDPAMKNVIAVYEPTVEAFRSAISIMYGADQPRGKLPVKEKK